ncbi:hypothetical protein [Rhizobium laguerreae]|uniref:hypothetical protein n=1 Tax=Rhizobium laguerreae TaxID=1076926 RepID=UPI001C90342E|nr:hypothetical protein [Rhizobium laguerreae]MBY3247427.1 hypothetical protein [Rhizobium laguerreae]
MTYSFSPFDEGHISHASRTTNPQNIAKSTVASGTMRPLAHRPPMATAKADMANSAVMRRDFIHPGYIKIHIMEAAGNPTGQQEEASQCQ